MKKKIIKNIEQRKLYNNFEKKRIVYKTLLKNSKLNLNYIIELKQNWFHFNKNTSLTQIKNICILTGRSHSVYRFCRLSRIMLRKFVAEGKLPGVSKYSW